MHKICLLLLWKSEWRKNNCFLVLGDKNIQNEEFLFFLLWKSEWSKNNCFLVLGDKNIQNEEFLFFKQNKY